MEALWNVGNYIKKGEIFPLDIFFYQAFKGLGLKLRNRVIWHVGHGVHESGDYSGRYETISWFPRGRHVHVPFGQRSSTRQCTRANDTIKDQNVECHLETH